MKYEGPYIMILEVSETDFLLSMSEIGPGAGDAGSPGFGAKKSSVWDEEIEDTEDTHY